MKKNTLILLLLFVFGKTLMAQDEFKYKTDVIPPSPNAAALGSYGGLSPNLVNGAVSVSIPLYSLKVANHDIGLALSYGSTGFKVDELCTSTGNGWSLQGGGLISRVIYDLPDERGQKIYPPDNAFFNKPEFNTFLQGARSDADAKSADAQPDQFNFNFMGYSGKFILDRFMHPVFIEHTNLQIEFSVSSYIDSFRITTPDGAKYFFGLKETTRSSSSCAINGSAFKPTSWFLTRIRYPNSEEVYFNYQGDYISYNMGISQTAYPGLVPVSTGCAGGGACPAFSNTYCKSYFDHNTYQLTSIVSSAGTLELTYTDRLNAVNSNGLQTKGQLLQTIGLKNPSGEKLKSFLLQYQNVYCTFNTNEWTTEEEWSRPFIINVQERDKNDITIKRHELEYNDLAGLPPRLSYSQDHWGYFNGQANATFLPKPTSFSGQANYTTATANRNPDDNFSKKGVLKKIIYPTGGEEVFNYESNTVWGSQFVTGPMSTVSTPSQGQGWKTLHTQTNSINIGFDQEIRLTAYVAPLDPYDPQYVNYDPQHNIGFFTVTAGGNVLYQHSWNPGSQDVAVLDVTAGQNITITVEAYGQVIHANALVDYIAGSGSWAYSNIPVGGLRVKDIALSEHPAGIPVKKSYYYSKLGTLTQSSGSANYTPNYNKNVISRIGCSIAGSYAMCSREALYSNAIYNLFIYPTGIQYEYLTESIGGANFENGGIQHTYTLNADARPFPILGQDVSGVPYQNNSIYSGKETETYIFNKDFLPVKKTVTEYKDDSTASKDIQGFTVTLKCQLPPRTDLLWPLDDEIESYNYSKNTILCRWIYKIREKVYQYDPNGVSYLVDQFDYNYNDPAHALLHSTAKNNSKGNTIVQEIKYVADQVIVQAKTPYQAKVDLDNAVAACIATYNNELYIFNTSISQWVGAMHAQTMSCYQSLQNDCNSTTCQLWGCGSVSCGWNQLERIQDCIAHSSVPGLVSQFQTARQNSTHDATFNNCMNAALAQYNADINNYHAALQQAINNTNDEHVKAMLVMQQKGIISAVVSTTQFKDIVSQELAKTENKYKYWLNDQVDPHYIFSSINGNVTESKMTFDQYDAKGNVLDYKKENDVNNSFIWDYQNNYPVAKCTGAGSSDIAYTSFESDGSGNWTNSGTVLNGGGVTGTHSFNGTISKTFGTTTDYYVSLWCNTANTATVNGVAGTTVLSKGNWKLMQWTVTNTNSISITGSNFDEVRAHPIHAQMVTYTYDRLVGMTSQADSNNHIAYYEYDDFGRLQLIRDDDGNIVKTFNYHYKQP